MSRYLVLIFASLLLISCSKKMDNPVSPDQTDKSGLGKVSFSMSIPVKQIKAQYGFSIDSVTVRLQGSNEYKRKACIIKRYHNGNWNVFQSCNGKLFNFSRYVFRRRHNCNRFGHRDRSSRSASGCKHNAFFPRQFNY